VTRDFERYLDALPEEGEPEVRSRRPAPGKVSLTSSLRPAQGGVPITSADDQDAGYLSTPVQRKESAQHDDPFGWDSWAAPVNRGVQAVAADGVSAPGGRLPYIDQIQPSFGRHDVSGIEAHVGGRAAEASDAIGARAYATGNHVAFASAPDLHTAAHEAAHVVQQRGGVQLMGGVGEFGDRYERHADAVADKVVAGESAEVLLDEFGGSGASTSMVQRKKDDEPEKGAAEGEAGELTLPDGALYEIIGDSTSLKVRRSWFESGDQSDRMRELLEHLRERGPLWWAELPALRRAAQETKIRSFGGKKPVIQVDLSAMIYNFIGLPPRVTAMISGVGDSLQVTIHAGDVMVEPGTRLPLQEETARTIVEAASRFTGLAPISDAPAHLREIEVAAWGGRGVVSARLERAALDAMFGGSEVTAWLDAHRGSKKTGTSGARPADTGVVSDLTPEEAAWLKSWLAMKLERGSDTGGLLDRTMYELARKIDELKDRSPEAYDKVFEELRRGDAGPLTAMALERAIVEGEAAALGVGRNGRPTLDPVHPIPLPARIHQRAGRVVSGESVPFTIEVAWPPMVLGDQATEYRYRPFITSVDWVFQKVTGATHPGLPDQKILPGGMANLLGIPEEENKLPADAVTGTARRHRTYDGGPEPEDMRFQLADGELEAVWEVHAIVRHSHYLPAHLTTQVEVKTESRLMTDLRAEATEGMGDDIVGTPAELHSSFLDDRFGSDAYRNGFKFTGVLPEDFRARSPKEQDQIRTREIENARAMLEQLRKSQAGPTVIASAQRYLDGLERMDKGIEKDEAGGWRNFEIRGTFMSRTPGVSDGPLDLYGLESGDRLFGDVEVRLRDLSRRFDAGDMTTDGSGKTFEEALRRAFVKLCKAYPAGRVFVLAQDRVRPRDAVGFELDTGTAGEDLKARVWDPAVQAAVNLAGMATMIFLPGSAGIVMPALAVYNAAQTIDDIHENWVRGTLTMEEKTLGLVSIGLDILPFLGRAKPILGSRKAWMVLEGVDIGGESVYMTATTLAAARRIQENHVAAMADIYAQLVELEAATHASDPRLVALKHQFEERAKQVRSATVEAFGDAVIQRGTFVAAKGAFRGARQITEFLGELGGRGVFLEKSGVAPHYDHALGRIVGDPRHPSVDESTIERLLAEQDAHMRELAVAAAEDLGLEPGRVEVVVDVDNTVSKRGGGVRLGYVPGVRPEAARAKWKKQHDAQQKESGGTDEQTPPRPRSGEPEASDRGAEAGRGPSANGISDPRLTRTGDDYFSDASNLHSVREEMANAGSGDTISPIQYDPATNKAHFTIQRGQQRIRVEAAVASPITSGAELGSASNRIVGKPLTSAAVGHQILRDVNAGRLEALSSVGVDVAPGTKLSQEIELALGEVAPGKYVIVIGEARGVQWKFLPGIKSVGHTHPSFKGNDLPVVDGHRRISIADLLRHTADPLMAREVVLPSAPDVGLAARQGVAEHRVTTPFVVVDDMVMKPEAGSASAPLEVLILNSKEIGKLHDGNGGFRTVYHATLVGEVDGQPVAGMRTEVWAIEDHRVTDGSFIAMRQPDGMVPRSAAPTERISDSGNTPQRDTGDPVGDPAPSASVPSVPKSPEHSSAREEARRLVGSEERIERLAALTGEDLASLNALLRLSGANPGNNAAATVEQLLQFASARGADHRACGDLFALANGDASRFATLAAQTTRFSSPRTGAPSPQPTNLVDPSGALDFTRANTVHFLVRHTYLHFDTSDIKPANTFFPPGTTPAMVVADLEVAIERLRSHFTAATMPIQGQLGVQVGSKWMQVGWRTEGGGRVVGQFFPGSGPGVENIPADVMNAIAKIIGA